MFLSRLAAGRQCWQNACPHPGPGPLPRGEGEEKFPEKIARIAPLNVSETRPLTPALPLRRGEGESSPLHLRREVHGELDVFQRALGPEPDLRVSLSPGERVGVRGKGAFESPSAPAPTNGSWRESAEANGALVPLSSARVGRVSPERPGYVCQGGALVQTRPTEMFIGR